MMMIIRIIVIVSILMLARLQLQILKLTLILKLILTNARGEVSPEEHAFETVSTPDISATEYELVMK